MVVLLFGPLVGTPEFYLSVLLCCIYVAVLIEAGCFGCLRGVLSGKLLPGKLLPGKLLPGKLLPGKLLPNLDMLSAMFMSFCVCSRGWIHQLVWVGGGGGPSYVFSVSPGDLLVWGYFVN